MKRLHGTVWMALAALAVWTSVALGDGVMLSVTNVTAKQRYPWNGLVDIDYELACSDPSADVPLKVTAREEATGRALPVRYVRLENGEFGEELKVKLQDLQDGKGRLVWDAGRDLSGLVFDGVTVEVEAGVRLYLVVDLSAGSATNAVYPTSWLGAMPPGGWTDEYKTEKLVLRRIEPGTFTMGTPADELGRYTSEDLHEVTLTTPFYIGVFEVTQRQWELVMGKKPSWFNNSACYATRPVECVSYSTIRGNTNWPTSASVTASSFMGKLRARTTGFKWDLPTEAQWEYACRAGTEAALNSGKELTDTGLCANVAEVARYAYNSGYSPYGQYAGTDDTLTGTAAVGSYTPNAWGLYDMHGNVWEWCLDRSATNLGTNAVTDPKGVATNTIYRVERGGSWRDPARGCRSGRRGGYNETVGISENGFRLSVTTTE